MTLFKLLLMSLRAFLYLDILIHIHSFIFILPLSLLPPCIPLIVSFFHLSPPLCIMIKRLLWGSGIWILSFSLCLPIWPTKVFPNDSYSEARANKRLEKKNPVNVWFAFSGNLFSCQGHFDWLLASLVNSQITQAASISLYQLDKSAPSIIPTLIVQF